MNNLTSKEAFDYLINNPISVHKNLLERIILNDISYSFLYMNLAIKQRWRKLEKIICREKYTGKIWEYSKDVIKGRWPKAEKILLKSIHFSFFYSLYVLKNRWKKAECVISLDKEYIQKYTKNLMNYNHE